mgnify:CR=1 FL=1
MFGLFKKKKQQTEALTEKEEHSHNDNGAVDIAARTASNQATQIQMQKAAQTFAKPSQYTGNRNLFDSGAAKRNAKMQAFANGQKPIDPYTGAELELTKKAAKAKYGADWAKHLAEADHTQPLERIFEETKNDPWLTIENVRNAANSEDNLQVLSRSVNNAKRSKTNTEFVENDEYLTKTGVEMPEEGKQRAIAKEKHANEARNHQFRGDRAENIIHIGHEAGMAGAEYAGVTGLTMSGINNVTALLNGEKSAEEAIADTVAQSGEAAVNGYVMSSSLTVLGHQMENSSSEFIRSLAEANVPGKVVTAVMVTGNTLARWGSGEITTQECMIELGDKGLNMATMGYSMAVGQALIPIPVVGGAIGAMVGSTLTSSYYHQLIDELQKRELAHKERLRLTAEYKKAAGEARQFNDQLKEYRDQYFADCHECFDTAISTLKFAYETGDADGVINAANKITRKLGGEVKYETVNEYKKFVRSGQIDEF